MMRPANLVLDLLRTYRRKGTSVRSLMMTASMFGVSDNAMRVTLSRLVSRGLIEKVSRGHYRLTEGSDPINDFVEEWRLGENRRRAWQQDFLIAHNFKSGSAFSEKDHWVLYATGFRQFDSGLWMRPDNLTRQGDMLRNWLQGLGLSERCLIAESARLSTSDANRAFETYNTDKLDASYQALATVLTQSTARLPSLPTKAAMKESFKLGGEALQILAKDPYLPEEIQNSTNRQKLWQIMLDYDELGRDIWTDRPATMPTQMPADMTSYA